MNNVVLTSWVVDKANTTKVHGIFPSFVAAVKYIIGKEKVSNALARAILFDAEHVDETYQFVRPQKDRSEVHWCASLQPIRNEEGE